MSDKNDDSIIREVESRLDYLFRENDQSESLEFEEDNISENYPLKELRSIVLSIDWEINDEIMTSFIEETGKLDIEHKDDKIFRMFLKLLVLIAKYIKKKKAVAHPNAIKVFNSVFLHLDTVVSSKGITEGEKKKILFGEINKFNKLKEQIAATKPSLLKKMEEPEEIEFMPEDEKFDHEAPAEEITAAFEEEEPEEIEFMPEDEEFGHEAPAEEITAAFEEEEPEEIELFPLEERPAPEAHDEEITAAFEEEEPEEIEFMPEDEEFAYKSPTEEILDEFKEEEPEEIELLPLEERPAPEAHDKEITPAFIEESEVLEFMDEEEEIESEEPMGKTATEVTEESGEIRFISEEEETASEIPDIKIAAEMVNKQADASGLSPHEAFAFALEEIKQVIKAEFKALRAELKLWRESK